MNQDACTQGAKDVCTQVNKDAGTLGVMCVCSQGTEDAHAQGTLAPVGLKKPTGAAGEGS